MATRQPHQVQEHELKKFMHDSKILFARTGDAKEGKAIYGTTTGHILVEHNGKIVMTTQNTLKATNKYNSIP